MNYKWNLSDGYPKSNRLKVMTTFACGGGSTMGYKNAGFDVIAANDIDEKMQKVYIKNHNPKQFFLCSVNDLLNKNDLPEVDILDGSPPCSVFSTTGLRHRAWQEEKKFTEGQSKQILDDLFFDFIRLVKKMSPSVVIAENVEGMLLGNAKWYTQEVVKRITNLGYIVQVFLLNGAQMGLPQQRKRVFFIANKFNKKLVLNFDEEPIFYKDIRLESGTELKKTTPLFKRYWHEAKIGGSVGKFKSVKKAHPFKVPNTIMATNGSFPMDCFEPRYLYKEELELIGSYPGDYDYCSIKPQYLIGMSVPPLMMYKISNEIYKQFYA